MPAPFGTARKSRNSGCAAHRLNDGVGKRQTLEALAWAKSTLFPEHMPFVRGVEFNRLGLVITDEQHRFGVAQRARLAAKGQSPHLLVMSATPIPAPSPLSYTAISMFRCLTSSRPEEPRLKPMP